TRREESLAPRPVQPRVPMAAAWSGTCSLSLRSERSSRWPSRASSSPFSPLAIAFIFFRFQSDRFLTVQNFSLILQQVMVVGVVAIGQTLIILTAGIDLSCGMIMALGSIVMTKFAVDLGMNPFLAIFCGFLVCVAFGFLNGALV